MVGHLGGGVVIIIIALRTQLSSIYIGCYKAVSHSHSITGIGWHIAVDVMIIFMWLLLLLLAGYKKVFKVILE